MNVILVLTQDKSLFNIMKTTLNNNNYEVITSTEDEIILSMYRRGVKNLIIDLDYCDITTLTTLNDFLEIEYIPTIGICEDDHLIENKIMKNFKYIINKNVITTDLIKLLDNFTDFKIRYDKIRECYEAVDVIDSEIDKLFKNKRYSIKSLLANIFQNNEFIQNKPSLFLIFSVEDDSIKADIYRINNESIDYEKDALILNKGFLREHITINTEFFLNCDSETYSDVDTYKILLEGLFFGKDIDIKNFTGYTTTDIAVFAVNYNDIVTNYDAKVIKALCINLNLIKNVYRRIEDVNDAFKYTIEALARAGEASDDDTGGHIKRVNEYSKLIAELLGVDDEFTEVLYYSAQMHDVGKIHVPPEILKKPGKLTEEEFQIIKDHCNLGYKIIGNADHLKMAAEIALNHHEKYDGSGYPKGISSEEIPLPARIVALADIYDALRSPRAYKPGFSHERTTDIILNGDGRVMPYHFDPKILEVFKENHKKFDEIYEKIK